MSSPKRDPSSSSSWWRPAVSGALTGIATRALVQPLDVVKIRLQLQEEAKKEGKYRGTAHALRLIARQEGVGALWSGHVPAQALSAVYGLVQFAVFERTRKAIQGTMGFRTLEDLTCGALAGSAATLAAQPFDVVRTRLVVQAKNIAASKEYAGMVDGLTKIAKREGAPGLWKGLVPALAQVAPLAGLQFSLYWAAREHLHLSPLWAGALAGAIAKTAVYPLDLLRHRRQLADPGAFRRHESFGRTTAAANKGSLGLAAQIVQQEAKSALWKGLWPAQLKAAASTALTFFFYDLFTKVLQQK